MDSNRALALLSPPVAKRRRWLAWGVFTLLALALGIVQRTTPEMLAEADTGTGLHPLAWPMEFSFILSTLLAGVLTFRAWERIFPTTVPSLYSLYPLRGMSVVSRELRLTAADGLGMFAMLTAWILPSMFTIGRAYPSYILFYGLCAAFLCAALSFAVPVLFVRSALRESAQSAASRLAASSAPAVAFGTSLILLLLLKLGVEELALAFKHEPLFSALFSRNRATPIAVPNSAMFALGIPLIAATAALIFAVPLRASRWLHDMVHVSASMVSTPELSYGWIEAKAMEKKSLSHVQLLVHRDVERLKRAAPFRLLVTLVLTILAAFLGAFASSPTAEVALGLHAMWILLWLRMPRRVRLSYTASSLAWDSLLVSPEEIRSARRWTMIRALAPYALLLVLPTVSAWSWRQPWWLTTLAAVSLISVLIVHAVIAQREESHV